jgi:2-C-methyl-D-erythritol 4-phosphate cytidylyltransferase
MTPNPPTRAANPARPVSAICVAAGSGRRMGAARNKVLLDLAGEPLVVHTLRHLAAAGIDEIVLVIRDDDRDAIAAALLPLRLAGRIRFARGGAQRADSVRAGVLAASHDADYLLVHDAARPFVAPRLVADLLAAARRTGAAIPGLPLVDTVKRVANDVVLGTLDRSELRGIQTPQAFEAALLRRALAAAPAEFAPTDDAGWIEREGGAVEVVAGDPLNVKITTTADLALAPALLAAFRQRDGEPPP